MCGLWARVRVSLRVSGVWFRIMFMVTRVRVWVWGFELVGFVWLVGGLVGLGLGLELGLELVR